MAAILVLFVVSAVFPGCTGVGVAEEDGPAADLPLKHMSAEITVSGMYQTGVVRQVFGNPYDRPVEAVYVFPLPEDGAVSVMDMHIGERHVSGEIRERSRALEMYREAMREGRTAALLEQERPNVFTQTVGNILPGDSIVIRIEYTAPVPYESGTWELSFPIVVGPRFVPKGVSDADRIVPPVTPEGIRPGYGMELSVLLDPGMPVRRLESLNHGIVVEKRGTLPLIRLAPGESVPDRDFVLRYGTATEGIGTGFVAHNGNLGGHFMLMLEPDAAVDRSLVAPKEMFFVIDCSGSMMGQPMNVARETVRRFVEGMNPGDSFQIMRFSETAGSMSPRPMPNTPENVRAGVAYINSLSGQGGTMMIEGIRAAIGYPEDPERMRYIIFLTDGYIGNESEILGELQATVRDNTRLFSIGVGSSVNRYLIEGLAAEGIGSAAYVGLNEDPETAVAQIYRKINNPYLVGIELDWGDLPVEDVQFGGTGDLYDGEPLVITGRFLRPGSGSVRISGTLGGKVWSREVEVTLPEEGEGGEAADRLWASRRLAALRRAGYSPELSSSEREDLTETMIGVSLDYRVLCEYTAFVAVDSERRTRGGAASTVEIPLHMPEGVSYQGVFGTRAPCRGGVCGYYSMNGGPGGAVMNPVPLEQRFATEEWPSYEQEGAAPVVRLVAADDPLGARPSLFRSLMIELARELQAFLERKTGVSGALVLELTLDSFGRITGVAVLENTTGIPRLARESGDFLVGRTLDGAGAGTTRVEFAVE